jgi:hypothetical protein
MFERVRGAFLLGRHFLLELDSSLTDTVVIAANLVTLSTSAVAVYLCVNIEDRVRPLIC